MNYSMHLLLTLATTPTAAPAAGAAHVPTDRALPDLLAAAVQGLAQRVEAFRQQPVSPTRAQQFEQQLPEDVRELGRQVAQWAYNHLEPSDVQALAKQVRFE